MAWPRGTAPVLLLGAAWLALFWSLGGSASNGVGGLRGAEELVWAVGGNSGCAGTVGECSGAVEELELEHGGRRSLATSSYIGYTALRSDSVPCSQRGASYYNCQPGAQANPYSRGCSAITQCRTS